MLGPVVFSLGHIVAALSASFTVVLVARAVTALATGAFSAVGFVVATAAAGPGNATRPILTLRSAPDTKASSARRAIREVAGGWDSRQWRLPDAVFLVV